MTLYLWWSLGDDSLPEPLQRGWSKCSSRLCPWPPGPHWRVCTSWRGQGWSHPLCLHSLPPLPRPLSLVTRPMPRLSWQTQDLLLCQAWSRLRIHSGPCSQSWNWNVKFVSKSSSESIFCWVNITNISPGRIISLWQVAWLWLVNCVCTTFEIMQKLLKLKNIVNTQKTKGLLHMFS